jgi:hypothetical protein
MRRRVPATAVQREWREVCPGGGGAPVTEGVVSRQLWRSENGGRGAPAPAVQREAGNGGIRVRTGERQRRFFFHNNLYMANYHSTHIKKLNKINNTTVLPFDSIVRRKRPPYKSTTKRDIFTFISRD